MNYSIACGRIYAYQIGRSYAFRYSVYWSPIELGVNASIDGPYVSGLSLTHGLVEQRKHVWTFAGAYDETIRYSDSCPCIDPALTWPYKFPSYVGDSYFCDTGVGEKLVLNTRVALLKPDPSHWCRNAATRVTMLSLSP